MTLSTLCAPGVLCLPPSMAVHLELQILTSYLPARDTASLAFYLQITDTLTLEASGV